MKGSQKEKHRNLSEFVSDFVFDELYKYKFSAMKDQLYSNYSGEYNMTKIDEEVQLDNVEDLWNIVISINPDIFNEKR